MKFRTLLILTLAALAAVLLAASCSDGGEPAVTDGTETAEVTEPVETVPIRGKDGGEINDHKLYAWFENGSALIHRDDFEVGDSGSISVSMAKNEMEGVQLILASAVSHKGVRCELGPLFDVA